MCFLALASSDGDDLQMRKCHQGSLTSASCNSSEDFVQGTSRVWKKTSKRRTRFPYSLASRTRRRVTSFTNVPDSRIALHPVRFIALNRAGYMAEFRRYPIDFGSRVCVGEHSLSFFHLLHLLKLFLSLSFSNLIAWCKYPSFLCFIVCLLKYIRRAIDSPQFFPERSSTSYANSGIKLHNRKLD